MIHRLPARIGGATTLGLDTNERKRFALRAKNMIPPTSPCLPLIELPGSFAICKLDKDAALPAWATAGNFFSITRTTDELSIVCSQSDVPEDVPCERDWRCLRVAGTMAFSVVGVLASLVTPLAEAGISVFALSTFDTDYLLVKEKDLENAVVALRQYGHTVG